MQRSLGFDPDERLPWLSNPAPAKPRKRRSWAPPALFLAAMGAIGFGGWAWIERAQEQDSPTVRPVQSVPLPPPSVVPPSAAEPEAPSAAEREALRPIAAAEGQAVEPRPVSPAAKPPRERSGASSRARPAAEAASPYDPRAWRSGVPGRIIQLGAFATPAQAQGEWRRVYARYPLLRPLSPRIIKSRIRGRTHHRLQLGTFSQAHSELLCQRLRTLGEGCIVLGLRGPQ